ncbi:MAG: MurR/RpiR family transcriptional regulator [Carnobacterium maltaromaticum]
MNVIQDLIIVHNLDILEQNILIYLDEHLTTDHKLPIRTVAKANFTSTTAVFNLAKKLGFDGYSELLYFLKNQKQAILMPTNEQVQQLVFSANFQNLENDIAHFGELLEAHRDQKIFLLGFGFSHVAALYMQDKLLHAGFNALVTTHFQVLFNAESQDNLLIVISESGKNIRLIEIVETAVAMKLDVISFSSDETAPIAKLSNLPCIVHSRSQDVQLKNFAPLAMLLFDYLLVTI